MWAHALACFGKHAGAGKRRRERRLRQCSRHERMTVAMAFSESYHHTLFWPALLETVVEAGKYSIPWGPKTERVELHDALRRHRRGDAEAPRAHFEADCGAHRRRCASATGLGRGLAGRRRSRRAHHGAHCLCIVRPRITVSRTNCGAECGCSCASSQGGNRRSCAVRFAGARSRTNRGAHGGCPCAIDR